MIGLMGFSGGAFVENAAGAGEIGKGLYQTHIVNGHGTKGKGDVPVASSLTFSSVDLTNAQVQQKRDEELLKILREGQAGTSMPAWKGELSSQQTQEVLAHIRIVGK